MCVTIYTTIAYVVLVDTTLNEFHLNMNTYLFIAEINGTKQAIQLVWRDMYI